ncbi:hypothetical protein SKAU_G00282630 [Synaphobranchus kaupii]|uniref:Uncharacterized protein n=1 Tax=Synaphobranchus kaupii TaxID=118154 RepID=A0A9Q1EXD5_SYNKA|nr:hypothetical protein SKAU_G00282630 [Synaphobranchus kaupii]
MKEARARNDPSFTTASLSSVSFKKEKPPGNYNTRPSVTVRKTDVSAEVTTKVERVVDDLSRQRPIHHKPHPLKRCRGFRIMLLEDRKKFIKDNNICYRCLASTSHQAKNCHVTIRCVECESEKHLAVLHPGPASQTPEPLSSPKEHGGEEASSSKLDVTATCTKVCGNGFSGKSCSKICLVHVFPEGQRHNSKKMYAIVDDQSNLSLAKTEFFDMFDIQSTIEPYTLKTCAGVAETSAAQHHRHLRSIAAEIPPLDLDTDILLLIGRNLLRAHKVRKQLSGRDNDPYTQKLDLGWVIIGNVCLSSAHEPPEVSALKTHVLDNGRPSLLTPCDSRINVKENFSLMSYSKATPHQPQASSPYSRPTEESLGENVFRRTDTDNQLALSVEDIIFLKKMEGVFKMKLTAGSSNYHFAAPDVYAQTTNPAPTSGLCLFDACWTRRTT